MVRVVLRRKLSCDEVFFSGPPAPFHLPGSFLSHTHSPLFLSLIHTHTHTHTPLSLTHSHTLSFSLSSPHSHSQTQAHGICLKLTVRCSAYQNQNFRRENFNSALSSCFIDRLSAFDRPCLEFCLIWKIGINRTLGESNTTSSGRQCKLHSIFFEVSATLNVSSAKWT